jgi:hypothetical protein
VLLQNITIPSWCRYRVKQVVNSGRGDLRVANFVVRSFGRSPFCLQRFWARTYDSIRFVRIERKASAASSVRARPFSGKDAGSWDHKGGSPAALSLPPPRFLRDIPTRMLQRMSEGGNEIGGREAHPIRDIGRGIAVHVNLDLVKRFGRESLGGSGPQRLVAVQVIMSGRMHVHDRMDLPASPGSGKAYRSVIQAGVPTGESPVRTGEMVRHLF